MTKHARKSPRLQAVERPTAATVQIPLPVLGAFASIERSYFDLCIRAGQQVLDAMMEQDRTELCGPRWKRDPDRRAGRAGTAPSEVTLGGRRIQMTRPRVRSQAGQEVERPSFAFAAHRDPLDAHAVNAVACGISTRKYARSLDTLPDEVAERSTSKSAVSRRYVAMTTTQLTRWLTTPLGDRHFPIVLIDGIVLGDHTVVIALGIDTEGKKQVLGLREGHTEHSRVVKALLRDLVERGLDPERARLFVIGEGGMGQVVRARDHWADWMAERSGLLPVGVWGGTSLKANNDAGFTLIELLIVVAIIGIIAAIAVPGLLRPRVAGSEASAMGSVRAVNGAQAIYAASCGGGFYSPSLTNLATAPTIAGGDGFIGPDLGNDPSLKSGYSVALTAGPAAAGALASCNATVRGLVRWFQPTSWGQAQ